MPTAIQVGLTPGYALQSGDVIANLYTKVGGTMGFGEVVNTAANLTGSGNNNPATAFPINSSVTIVKTATNTANSAQLEPIAPLAFVRIYNTSAQTIHIFPPPGQSIDGGQVNASVALSGGARCDYMYLGNNVWQSDLLGTPSA